MAMRSYHTSKVRGGSREELPHSGGQGPHPKWSSPTAKEGLLGGCRRAERSYSMFKVRRGGREKIPLLQGKEQGLRASR